MKTIITLALLLSSASAIAGDFSLNIEGKSFTCTEGGSGSAGCECKRTPDDNNYLAAYSGDILLEGGWRADLQGLTRCKEWIRNAAVCK